MIFRKHLRFTLVLAAASVAGLPLAASASESVWVQRGVTGRLIYVPDAEGDTVPDFSDVGYKGGREPIPTVATSVTVPTVTGDATQAIQDAIDLVSQMPLGPNGFRGAVQLSAGDYSIGGQLSIGHSGVVLRGAGQQVGGTNLIATGTSQRPLIEIDGGGSQSTTGSTRNFIDKVVPVGARSFRVDSTSDFSVGDTVRVTRPSTANWISDLGTDMIPPRSDGGTVNQWEEGDFDIRYDRVITRIEGDRIFVDAPLTNAFELQYGGGQIKRYTWDNGNEDDRIRNIGVENLRAESTFTSPTDEDHSWTFVSVADAQDVWVRDATSSHFADSSVLSNPTAKWVTVDNVTNLDPVSQVTGGRRYTFDLSGQLELVTNSEANSGRHDFVNNSSRPAGPHVFHNSVANNALSDSGPHQRWATGSLFDNIVVDGDEINARNRGNFGTGHGWSGANMVIWNSTAEGFIVQNPPTAQNWLIGSTGTVIDDQTFGPQPAGYIDSHGSPIQEIDSLYEAQVADAADVTTFRWSGAEGVWSDPEAWVEKLTPSNYKVEARDYLIGDIDGFTFDGSGSVDDAFVDPVFQAAYESSSSFGTTGFDDTNSNMNVGFTVQHQLDPGERVVHGTLALSLGANANDVSNDFIRLFDTGSAGERFDLDVLGWDVPLEADGTFVGVLDLGAFTDKLQTGAVNVQVNDDTGVDWVIYKAVVASEVASPGTADVVIEGAGRATVDSTIANVGNLTVGGATAGGLVIDDSGSLTLAADYEQAANGVLELVLGGATPGQFGTLNVGGDASLAGGVEVSLDAGYSPSLGDAFPVLTTTGSLLGGFDSITTPSLDPGLTWSTFTTPNSFLLVVTLAGDFNSDGMVDAADYTVWRDNLNSTTNLAADADGSGVVDIADYLIWKSAFGNSAADFASVAAATVPEPTVAVMAVLTPIPTYSRRQRRLR